MNQLYPGSRWAPVSVCDAECLPSQGTGVIGVALRLRRLLTSVAVLLGGAAVVLIRPLLSPVDRQRVVASWARLLLTALGVRLVAEPPPAPRGSLIVANHVSWLDILALLALSPARLVAKSDVAQWPLIGMLARRGGTIFIERGRLRALPGTVAAMAAALRAGDNVAAFPEATTWCGGEHRGGWRPAMFQAAVAAGAMVQPARLDYRLADGRPTTIAAFVGPDPLWTSALRVMGTRGLTLHVTWSAPLDATDLDRRTLARLATPDFGPAQVTWPATGRPNGLAQQAAAGPAESLAVAG
jgi:1-acyl-sn-glycerol-3-phosphate acyltransferase